MYIKLWYDRWNSYWFPETTTLNLSICRIIVVTAQLMLFFPSLETQINLLEGGIEFIDPQLLIYVMSIVTPSAKFFTPAAFTLLYWLTLIAGVSTLIGLFTRTSAFIFASGNWILIAHAYSYGEKHHPEAIFCIFLMLLAFSPSGGGLSVDALLRSRRNDVKCSRPHESVETATWPLKLTQVLISFAYFSTGITKILYGGLSWVNGHTLQQYMFGDAILFGSSFGIWLAQQHTICIILSIGTVFFELFFFLTLFLPWIVPFFLIGGLFFHGGIYVAMAATFFQHIILYVVFIDFEHILAAWRSGRILVWRNVLHLASGKR